MQEQTLLRASKHYVRACTKVCLLVNQQMCYVYDVREYNLNEYKYITTKINEASQTLNSLLSIKFDLTQTNFSKMQQNQIY